LVLLWELGLPPVGIWCTPWEPPFRHRHVLPVFNDFSMEVTTLEQSQYRTLPLTHPLGSRQSDGARSRRWRSPCML
jgi:hypothetical protein